MGLDKRNIRYDIAENGVIAVECFKKEKYAAIFMDIEMPEMDGYEATKAIRKLEKDNKIEHGVYICGLSADSDLGIVFRTFRNID